MKYLVVCNLHHLECTYEQIQPLRYSILCRTAVPLVGYRTQREGEHMGLRTFFPCRDIEEFVLHRRGIGKQRERDPGSLSRKGS
jgi:hypothetical protein